jgi:hypothetical protein
MDRIKGEVEQLTEQVVDATHLFSETLEGGSLQGQKSLVLKCHFTWALKKGLFSHNSVFCCDFPVASKVPLCML